MLPPRQYLISHLVIVSPEPTRQAAFFFFKGRSSVSRYITIDCKDDGILSSAISASALSLAQEVDTARQDLAVALRE
jgi:hypothetical protein